MLWTKSHNLDLIGERKFNGSGYIIFFFLEMSLFDFYLIRINGIMGMVKIWLETNYIHKRYYCVRYFYVTVTVRSTTIITDYVDMIAVLSP